MEEKYYLLIAIGHSLSLEQTHEVLLRTSDLQEVIHFRKYPEYQTILNDLGINLPKGEIDEDQILKRVYNSIQALDLNYLANEQFATSDFKGLHGWLDWEGQIKVSNFDIGKYPKEEELEQEVKLLSNAFPFLKMWFQFLPIDKSGSISYTPTRSFHIQDGEYNKYGKGQVELKLEPTEPYNPTPQDRSIFKPKYNSQVLKHVLDKLY